MGGLKEGEKGGGGELQGGASSSVPLITASEKYAGLGLDTLPDFPRFFLHVLFLHISPNYTVTSPPLHPADTQDQSSTCFSDGLFGKG